MLQHIPLCDGWKSWTLLNRAGPGSRSIPLGFGVLKLYPSAAQLRRLGPFWASRVKSAPGEPSGAVSTSASRDSRPKP
jgi:hypothetical protein